MTSVGSLNALYLENREQFIKLLVYQYRLELEDAKDIYQSSIVAAYENIQNGKFESKSSVKTYLFAICKNKALAFKSGKNSRTSPLQNFDVGDPTPDVGEDTEVMLLAVEKSIEKIGDKCKTILTKYYYYKLSMETIAEVCGFKNAATATNEKYKCIMKLRGIFQSVYQAHQL